MKTQLGQIIDPKLTSSVITSPHHKSLFLHYRKLQLVVNHAQARPSCHACVNIIYYYYYGQQEAIMDYCIALLGYYHWHS